MEDESKGIYGVHVGGPLFQRWNDRYQMATLVLAHERGVTWSSSDEEVDGLLQEALQLTNQLNEWLMAELRAFYQAPIEAVIHVTKDDGWVLGVPVKEMTSIRFPEGFVKNNAKVLK